MAKLAIEETNGGVVFTAKVVPGSSRTAVSGLLDDMLKVKVAAAPEKGKANKCLAAYLARELGVKKKAVCIVSGQTAAVKQIRVSGISAEGLLTKLNLNKGARI
jgi:uncharacterized protein (TIGR00251 family)